MPPAADLETGSGYAGPVAQRNSAPEEEQGTRSSFIRRGSLTHEDLDVARLAQKTPGETDPEEGLWDSDVDSLDTGILESPVRSAHLHNLLPKNGFYFVQKPEDWRDDLPSSVRDADYPDERKFRFEDYFSIVFAAFKWHAAVIATGVVSASIHWHFGLGGERQEKLIDPLVFKSIFLVFGFCLGFRNVRANNRMEEALRYLHDFIATSWTIILLFPNSHRWKVSNALVQAMRETASYLHSISVRKHWWAAMIDVRPRHQDVSMAGSSARPLLLAALSLAEDAVYELEPGPNGNANKQTMRRSFWVLRTKMTDCYDRLVQMTLPAVSDRYAGLLDTCLLVFAALLPFGLHAVDFDMNDITHRGHVIIPAGFLTLVNSCVVLIVMTGLNALAQENEDPFGRDDEDVRTDAYVRLFERGLQVYEEKRARVEALLETGSQSLKAKGASDAQLEVWRHCLVCNDLLAHVKQEEFDRMALQHARVVNKYLSLGGPNKPPLSAAGPRTASYGATGASVPMARPGSQRKTKELL